MAYPLGPPIPAAESPPVVQHNCFCARCAYNLRGLSPAGVCPECGAPIAISMEGRLLRFADRHYVRNVNLGLTILLCAIWLYVFLLAVSILLGVFIKARQSQELAEDVSRAIMLLPTIAFVAGYWKFTAPDVGSFETERAVNTRNIIRIAACVQLAAKLCALVTSLAIHSQSAAATTPGFSSPLQPVAIALMWVDLTAWTTLFYAVLIHVRTIADRVPNMEIRARAKGFMWFLPLVFIIGLFIFGVGPVIALILYATLLQSLQQHFKETIDWQERGGRFTFS
jgi:hypothetical protein